MLLRGGPQDLVSKQVQLQPQGKTGLSFLHKPKQAQQSVTITPQADPSEDSA